MSIFKKLNEFKSAVGKVKKDGANPFHKSKYSGEWKSGEKHGHGTESYPSGKKKAGYWVRDIYAGEKKPKVLE